MRFFHPRIALIQPLIPIPDFWELSSEPQSEWAREFASFRALYREGHSIIVTSDSRSRLINFAALKQSAEATLGKVVVAIDWVAEGGTNQVRVEFFSNSSSAEKAPFLSRSIFCSWTMGPKFLLESCFHFHTKFAQERHLPIKRTMIVYGNLIGCSPRCDSLIPYSPNIPQFLHTQVDTIRYLKEHTELPIPEVYMYVDRIDNAVGAPYMIAEVVSSYLS